MQLSETHGIDGQNDTGAGMRSSSAGGQALIKYLPPEWADGLQQDIFNNTSRDFEGDPAYDLYVRLVCGGQDPQQVASRTDRLHRLARGTDETSITYL